MAEPVNLREIQAACFPEVKKKRLSLMAVFEYLFSDPILYFSKLNHRQLDYVSSLISGYLTKIMEQFGSPVALHVCICNIEALLCGNTECTGCIFAAGTAIRNLAVVLEHVIVTASESKVQAWNAIEAQFHGNTFMNNFSYFLEHTSQDERDGYNKLVFDIARIARACVTLMPNTCEDDVQQTLYHILINSMDELCSCEQLDVIVPSMLLLMVKMESFNDCIGLINIFVPIICESNEKIATKRFEQQIAVNLSIKLNSSNKNVFNPADSVTLRSLAKLQSTFALYYPSGEGAPFELNPYVKLCVQKVKEVAMLREPDEKAALPFECIACRCAPRQAVAVSCGHLVLCTGCADKCGDVCPMCRCNTVFKRIFL